jgi:hypothetical protein
MAIPLLYVHRPIGHLAMGPAFVSVGDRKLVAKYVKDDLSSVLLRASNAIDTELLSRA